MIKTNDLIKAVQDRGLIPAEKLDKILAEAGQENTDVGDLLRRMIDPEELAKIEAEKCGLPYKNLIEEKIEEKVLHTISSDVAQNYHIICFDRVENEIKIGITDADNFKAVEAIDFLAKEGGLSVQYYFISPQSFAVAFKKYKSLSKELSSALEVRAGEGNEQGNEGDAEDIGDDVNKSAPVAKIVSVIIRHAVDGGASDIHIEPLKNESRVRYRIDGILHTSLVLPKSVHRAIVARIKVMSDMKLDETRIPQDGRFRMIISEKPIDFRVSTLPLIGSEKVVMRILDTSKGTPKIEELGIQGVQLDIIQKNMHRTEGMFLVTGPTGSGKSTTIFSILAIINVEGVNIATLEDPVEYQLPGVNQSQIRPQIGYTFASGLRSFLRQDPNVIMVGEIRDSETAELATHAALTGHSVFSTLHTTSAPASIARLIDMGIEPFLVGSTVHTIIAQRLVRKICPHCKKEVELPAGFIDDIKKTVAEINGDYLRKIVVDFDPEHLKFYKGEGCARCGNTGYRGRISILEVLDVVRELQEIIKEGKKFLSLKDIQATQNFITVKQDGILKVLQGMTTIEEVLRVMSD